MSTAPQDPLDRFVRLITETAAEGDNPAAFAAAALHVVSTSLKDVERRLAEMERKVAQLDREII